MWWTRDVGQPCDDQLPPAGIPERCGGHHAHSPSSRARGTARGADGAWWLGLGAGQEKEGQHRGREAASSSPADDVEVQVRRGASRLILVSPHRRLGPRELAWTAQRSKQPSG